MEKEKNALVNELIRGKELTEQLKRSLKHSSKEIKKVLLENILSSCGKAMSMLRDIPPCYIANGSPRSEGSNHSYKGACKRRKGIHSRTERVKVSQGYNLEGTVDHGYSWRKYGQKDILGANFPREYFRCTNSVSHGCLATRLVQRSNEDPNMLEVTYKGQHTCLQNNNIDTPALAAASQCLRSKALEQSKQEWDIPVKSETTLNFQCGGLETETETLSNSPYTFAFCGNNVAENGNSSQEFALDNKFTGSISRSFGSPASLESTYLSSLSTCPVDSFGLSQYIPNLEADIAEMVSCPAFDFPVQNFDCWLDSPELFLWISQQNLESAV